MQCIVKYVTGMYKVLILGTYHPDIIHLPKQGCENRWVLFEPKKGSAKQKSGKHCNKWPAPSLADVPSIRDSNRLISQTSN
jgi:hypothetical protein